MDTKKKTLNVAIATALLGTAGIVTLPAQAAPKQVELEGYFRSGAGTSSESGNIACVRLPGATTWFRLGNECDTYVALTFGANLGKVEDTTFKAKFTFAQGTQGLANWEASAPALREAFVSADNIGSALEMPSLNGTSLWVGKRYYKNPDIHMLDYTYWEPAQGPGFGIDNIDVGVGQFSYAMFRIGDFTGYGISNNLTGFNPDLIGGGSRTATVHDFRLQKIDTNPGGAVTVGVNLIRASNHDGTSTYTTTVPQAVDLDNNPATPPVNVMVQQTNTIDNKPGKNGIAFTLVHEQENLFGVGGTNTLGFQFGNDAAMLKGWGAAGSTDDRKEWMLFDHWLYKPENSRWSATSTFGYRNAEINNVTMKELWLGTRPHYAINKVVSLFSEVGYQQVKPEGGETRKLTKATIGTQFALGNDVTVRPALRLFATYAKWNDAAAAAGSVVCSGRDCGRPVDVFASKRSGVFYGAQVEAWF